MNFNIARDYSPYTGLRHSINSELSGEDFYHKKLNSAFAEALQNQEKLFLELDGSLDGYAPSFLDEAIGNLVYDFGLEVVKSNLVIKSERESQWIVMIEQQTFPNWAKRRKDKDIPTVTEQHSAWYRLVNGELKLKIWCSPNK